MALRLTRNITLKLPEDIVRRLKIVAARGGTSISALLTAALTQLADEEAGYAEARDGMLSDLTAGNQGTGGNATWSRDSLYER